jgi:hypothetical protein
MNEDLYEFMYFGHDIMRAFERAHPEDDEGLTVLAAYIGLATTLACQALAPGVSHESIVADYWSRVKHENPGCIVDARH